MICKKRRNKTKRSAQLSLLLTANNHLRSAKKETMTTMTMTTMTMTTTMTTTKHLLQHQARERAEVLDSEVESENGSQKRGSMAFATGFALFIWRTENHA